MVSFLAGSGPPVSTAPLRTRLRNDVVYEPRVNHDLVFVAIRSLVDLDESGTTERERHVDDDAYDVRAGGHR